MPKGRSTVLVLELKPKDVRGSETLNATRDTLRALRRLGVRFSETTVEGESTTVEAWVETPEPKAPRVPRQTGAASPAGPSANGAEGRTLDQSHTDSAVAAGR